MVDHRVLIGLTEHGVRPALASLTGALTCTLVADRRDTGPPDQIAVPDLGPACHAIADPLAGAYAAAAVAAALLGPRGQLLDISMYDVAVAAVLGQHTREVLAGR